MTSFLTRSGPDGDGAYVHTIIVTTDNDKHYKYVQEAARFCIDHMKPRTNADRIRSMTDEELAEKNVRKTRTPVSGYYEYGEMYTDYIEAWETSDGAVFWTREPAVEYELYWLKQPYKEDG